MSASAEWGLHLPTRDMFIEDFLIISEGQAPEVRSRSNNDPPVLNYIILSLRMKPQTPASLTTSSRASPTSTSERW